MKKLLAILLLLAAPVFAQDITGAGTNGDPYLLYNAADFDSIRYLGIDKFYKLANDIDFTSWGSWTPIKGVFSGQLDLNHKKLSHLVINQLNKSSGADSVGIFAGLTNTASQTFRCIKNGRIDSCSITLTGNMSSGSGHYIGMLAGYVKAPGGSDPSVPMLDSLIVTNISINISNANTRSYSPCIGGLLGVIDGSIHFALERVYVNADINYSCPNTTQSNQFYGIGGIVGSAQGGAINMSLCAFVGSVVHTGPTTVGLSLKAGGLVGLFQTSSAVDGTFINCYVRATKIHEVKFWAGGLFGDNRSTNTIFTNCYTLIDTLLAEYSVGNDLDGLIVGAGESTATYTNLYTDTQYVKVDLTDVGANTDRTIIGQSEAVVPGSALTTAEAKDTSSYTDWDFTTIWDVDVTVNDGYPFLRWVYYVPPVVLDISTPNGGESYTWPDTVSIVWTQTEGDSTSYKLWYSLNNGTAWTFIDSAIVDTTYEWIIPNVNSNNTLILVTSSDSVGIDESDAVFTLQSGPDIQILYPIDSEEMIVIGDTIHISVYSVNIDSMTLAFSQDNQATWHYIAGVSVDTTNGFLQDTTIYIWTLAGLGTGDIYLRAATQADTTIYYSADDIYLGQIGSLGPSPAIYCSFPGPIAIPIKWQIYEDPGCGYSSPPVTARTMLINSDATDYDMLTAVCTGSCDPEEWPDRDPVWLDNGGIITEHVWTEFYNDVNNDSVTYKNRLYWYNPADTCLYMNDLTNSIDSMKLIDLRPYTGSGKYFNVPIYRMQVYNIQYDKIVGDTLDIATDFESLNDDLFVPKLIMVGTNSLSVPTAMTMSLLPTPNNQAYAEDVVLAFANPSIQRFYFRGIHPKAEKR